MPRKAISKLRHNPTVKKAVDYTIDLSQPTEDEVIDVADFVDFLKQHLKVDGKKGNLDGVEISNTEAKVSGAWGILKRRSPCLPHTSSARSTSSS